MLQAVLLECVANTWERAVVFLHLHVARRDLPRFMNMIEQEADLMLLALLALRQWLRAAMTLHMIALLSGCRRCCCHCYGKFLALAGNCCTAQVSTCRDTNHMLSYGVSKIFSSCCSDTYQALPCCSRGVWHSGVLSRLLSALVHLLVSFLACTCAAIGWAGHWPKVCSNMRVSQVLCRL